MDVAVAIGIERSSLSSLESGRDRPGRETLVALASFFDVSLDWLATGQGPMKLGEAQAANEAEALLLFGFRQLPEDEAKHLLAMIMSRVKPKAS